jgi:hypothetical protein
MAVCIVEVIINQGLAAHDGHGHEPVPSASDGLIYRGILPDYKIDTNSTINSAIVMEPDLLDTTHYPVAPLNDCQGQPTSAIVTEASIGLTCGKFPCFC